MLNSREKVPLELQVPSVTDHKSSKGFYNHMRKIDTVVQ